MWQIYVILTLWTQSSYAQQGVYMTNSRGGGGKNTFKTSDVYLDYNYNNNTYIQMTKLPSRTYNTNSRDSFGTAHAVAENNLHSHTTETHQNANTHIVNNLTTKSPVLDADSITTQPSAAWKIPTGDSFNSKLFDVMSSNAQYENLVYSPISLQTLLAFIFTMSDGKLYEELAQLLAISNNRTYVAKYFENIMQAAALNTQNTKLFMANKLYYDFRFGPVDYSIQNFAEKSFASEMQQIDFFSSKKAANIINLWIRERTRNLIRDVVTPSSISGDTSALLLNSIYFKSDWLMKFATYDTEIQDFFVTRQERVAVNMMYNEDVFRFKDFHEDLQASVLELPYETSNLSMLLILPKDIEGLADLERKLRHFDIESIPQKLKRETVTVKLPKFKIEYEIDMIKTLQQMGLNALFNNFASINLFKNSEKPLKIDQFKHKTIINVNEAGTEAAATTVAKYVPLSIPSDMKQFIADHPFVFLIRNSITTFFIGHVVKF